MEISPVTKHDPIPPQSAAAKTVSSLISSNWLGKIPVQLDVAYPICTEIIQNDHLHMYLYQSPSAKQFDLVRIGSPQVFGEEKPPGGATI